MTRALLSLLLASPVVYFYETAQVAHVVDGDTADFVVLHRPGLAEGVRVRFTCDAPELRADGGRAARQRLVDFLDGGTVGLQVQWHPVEKYGRRLGQPFREVDGGWVGFCGGGR